MELNHGLDPILPQQKMTRQVVSEKFEPPPTYQATAPFEVQEGRGNNEEDSPYHASHRAVDPTADHSGRRNSVTTHVSVQGTFDTGPLAGTAYTGTFTYDTAGSPNLQTGIPLTFSVPSTFDTRQIEAHPNGLPLFTLVDARQVGGSVYTSALAASYLPSLIDPCPPIQFESVFFSPDPGFAVVDIDNDTDVRLAPAGVPDLARAPAGHRPGGTASLELATPAHRARLRFPYNRPQSNDERRRP